MPNIDDHARKFKHNCELLNSQELGKVENIDWAVTLTFYAAVHLIEEYFASKQLHCKSHIDRNNCMMRERTLLRYKIPPKYQTLYNQSIMARYECVEMSAKHLEAAKEALGFIESKLKLA